MENGSFVDWSVKAAEGVSRVTKQVAGIEVGGVRIGLLVELHNTVKNIAKDRTEKAILASRDPFVMMDSEERNRNKFRAVEKEGNIIKLLVADEGELRRRLATQKTGSVEMGKTVNWAMALRQVLKSGAESTLAGYLAGRTEMVRTEMNEAVRVMDQRGGQIEPEFVAYFRSRLTEMASSIGEDIRREDIGRVAGEVFRAQTGVRLCEGVASGNVGAIQEMGRGAKREWEEIDSRQGIMRTRMRVGSIDDRARRLLRGRETDTGDFYIGGVKVPSIDRSTATLIQGAMDGNDLARDELSRRLTRFNPNGEPLEGLRETFIRGVDLGPSGVRGRSGFERQEMNYLVPVIAYLQEKRKDMDRERLLRGVIAKASQVR